MNDTFIDDFYYGNIGAQETNLTKDARFKKKMNQLSNSEKEIFESLKGAEYDLFEAYPMSEEVKNILMSIKEQENQKRKLFGKEYIENDYIFKWGNGNPFKPDFISRKFSQLLEKYNLRHIRFHDLRHSCASLLVANGFTLKDIQEWLGHSDIQTTANIYAHLDIERKNKIAASMTNCLNF